MCLGVPPAPVYKGTRGGGWPAPIGAPGGVLLLVGVGLLLGGGRKWGGRRKGGRRPPLLVQFGPVHGEGCGHPLRPFSPFPHGPLRPNTNSRNSLVLRKIPESLRTFLMSEYSLPIYRPLHLEHFETPRHVRDDIRDSKLTSVHQNS